MFLLWSVCPQGGGVGLDVLVVALVSLIIYWMYENVLDIFCGPKFSNWRPCNCDNNSTTYTNGTLTVKMSIYKYHMRGTSLIKGLKGYTLFKKYSTSSKRNGSHRVWCFGCCSRFTHNLLDVWKMENQFKVSTSLSVFMETEELERVGTVYSLTKIPLNYQENDNS